MKGGGGMKMGPTQQQPTQILQKPQVWVPHVNRNIGSRLVKLGGFAEKRENKSMHDVVIFCQGVMGGVRGS